MLDNEVDEIDYIADDIDVLDFVMDDVEGGGGGYEVVDDYDMVSKISLLFLAMLLFVRVS